MDPYRVSSMMKMLHAASSRLTRLELEIFWKYLAGSTYTAATIRRDNLILPYSCPLGRCTIAFSLFLSVFCLDSFLGRNFGVSRDFYRPLTLIYTSMCFSLIIIIRNQFTSNSYVRVDSHGATRVRGAKGGSPTRLYNLTCIPCEIGNF